MASNVTREDRYTVDCTTHGKPQIRGPDTGDVQPPEPIWTPMAPDEIAIPAECQTEPTGTGGRTDCNSDVHRVTLDEGCVFIKDKAYVTWDIQIGDGTDATPGWADEVVVVPGTAITEPRTATFWVHARSGHGQGERGHARAWLHAPYVKLPSS